MQSAGYVALSRQSEINHNMDVVANNIANASTTGFKEEQAIFQQFLQPGPNGQTISYVRDVGTIRDLKQGDLTTTGNSLDAAIDGGGYFSVATQDGVRYTRDGRFQLSASGQLVTSQGDPVADTAGNPITIPRNAHDIKMMRDGTISTELGPVGKLGIVSFDNPQQLMPSADGLFVTDETPAPDAASSVHQGMLESSNVQPITEITRLLGLQGSYTDIQQILEGEDTRLKNAVDKLSRIA